MDVAGSQRHVFSSLVIVLAACMTTSAAGAATAATAYPALEMNGLQYPNACSKPEQARLRNSISGGVNDTPGLWRAVNAILCAPRTGPERIYLTSLFPKRVKQESEDTGQEPSVAFVQRSDALIDRVMAAGEAWDAEVRGGADTAVVQYFANEACVKNVTLAYRQAKWRVGGIGEACD